MALTKVIYVESDNEIKLEGLKEARTGTFINNAAVKATLVEKTKLVVSVAALTSENGGAATGLACANSKVAIGDKVWIKGTKNCDGLYIALAGTTIDKLVIGVAYIADVLTGKEEIYRVISACAEQVLEYEAESNGDYYGTILNSALLFEGEEYYLFIVATYNGVVTTLRETYKAAYL
jgi:hypothetical protein